MKIKFLYSWIGFSLLFLLLGNNVTKASSINTWSFAPVCTTPIISTFPSTETFDVLVPNDGSIFACIATDNMTDCWINNPANTNLWAARSAATGSSNTGPATDNTTGTGNYVFLESSSCNGITSILQGPVYDVSALTSPAVTFYYHMLGATMGTLALEGTTDGVTWTQLWSLSGDQGNAWTPVSVSLFAYAGATTLSLRFSGTTGTSFTSDMAIDDITVEEIACVAPSGLTATNVIGTQADLGWLAGPETQWILEYGPTGFTPGTGTSITVTTNPYTLTGLMTTTSYDYYVTADCGPGGLSTQTGPVTFTTTVLCPAPTNLAANSITDSSADLAWTVGGAETQWVVEYGPTGFTPGTGTMVTTTTNPHPLTGIPSSTAFDFYVTADCGPGGLSIQTGPSAFTTLNPPETAPYCQAFENAGTIPTGWTNLAGELWRYSIGPITGGHVGNGGQLVDHTTGTGYFAWVDDSSPQSIGTTLQSPLVDVSALTSPEVSFWYASDNEGFTNVDFSVNLWDGAAWNNGVHTSNTNTNGWLEVIIDLSLYTITGPVQVQFVVDENNGSDFYDDLAIDDVCFRNTPTCFTVTNLTTANVLATQADLGWTAGGTETQWILEYGPTGFTPGTGTSVTVTTNPYTLTGLMPTTSYDYYVTADCGVDGLSTTAGPLAFATIASCPAPTSLTSSALDSQASLAWTAGGTEIQWIIEYGPSGFTPGTGTSVTVTTNPYVLTGLFPQTTYDYYVTADCGATDGLSLQVGPEPFTTLCLAILAPYCGDFENAGAIPTCWSDLGTEAWRYNIGPFTGHTGNAGNLADHTTGTGYFAWVDDSSPHNTGTTLQTPLVDVSALTSPEVSFWYASDNEGFTNVDFSVNLWDGAAWNNGVHTSNTNTIGWTEVIINLSSYTISGPVMLAFVVDENNGSDFYDDVAIDDVCFRNTPSCPAVTGLAATNITTTQADLGWVAGLETQWEIEYGPSGFTPGTGTTVTVTTNPYTLTGLMPQTSYDFYVAADCGVTGLSVQVGPGPFTTLCAVVMAPYCEDFENAGTIPNCWENMGAEPWRYNIGPFTGHTGNVGDLVDHTTGTGYFAWVDDSSPQSTGTTLQTPFVDVSGLSSPEVSFWLASDNEGFTNVDFSVNLWDGATWNNGVYTSNTNTNGWLEVVIDLATYTITGPVSLAFVVDENNGTDFYDDVAIDDVCFRNAPTCPAPTSLTATNITENTADLSWMSAGTAFSLEYGPCGFTKGTGTGVGTAAANYALAGLTPGTCYEYYVQNDCGAISNLVLTGIGDGPLTGGQPKFIELYAAKPIADLGIYGLESVNNGGGAMGVEFTFPAGVAVAQGTYLYITGDSAAFNMFFGFDADYLNSAATSINGDDAVGLYENGVLIDMAGDPNMDGTGTPWEYLDGWMYKAAGLGNSATFNVTDWVYSGINVFDGQSTNAGSPTPFPLQSFDPPVSTCVGPFAFTTLVGCGGPFYDNGGVANVYNSSSNDTITICPQVAGEIVTVNFTLFDVEPRTDTTCWDALFIYDGVNTGAPVIQSTAGTDDWCWDALATPQFGTGNLVGVPITSSDPSGCLTFVFNSDASVAFDGWEATVSCDLPPCPDPSALGATNITHNSADLTWVSPGTAHVVEYGGTGFTPGTGTMATATTSPYTLGGLIPNTMYDYYLKNNCGDPTSDLQIVGILDADLPNNLHAVMLYANADIPDLSAYSVKQSTNGGGTISYSVILPAMPLAAGTQYYIGRQPSSFTAFFGFAPDFAAAIALNGDDALGLYKGNVLIDLYGDYAVDGTGTAWDYTSGWAVRNNNTPNNGGVFNPSDWNINNQVFVTAAPNSTQPLPYPVNQFVGSSGLGLSACIGPFSFTTLCSPIATVIDSVFNVSCNGSVDGAIYITPINGVAPYTFAWSNGSTTEDLTGLIPGTYVATVSDAVGCSFVAPPFTITEPTAVAITVDGFTNVSCNGGADGSISITTTGGTPPYTYTWSNGATSEDVTGLSAGTYSGTITDANGCILVAGPVNITEPAMPISFILDAMTDVSCNGGADGSILIATTGGTPPYSFNWSNGANTEDLTGLSAGTYEGTITDGNGCILTSGPVVISEPAPILLSATHVDATPSGGGTDGSIDLMISGGTTPYTYAWNNGATTEDLTGLSLGSYTVTVTDANGCTETYVQALGNTAVVDIDELQKFELFPNPTNGQTQIVLEFEKAVDLNIRIVNVLGQVIHEESDNQVKSNQYTIDMTKAAAGTYFVHLLVEGAVRTKQLVVTR